MKQLIMPPFVPIEVPPGAGHDAEQEGAVALGLGPDVEVAMVRQWREVIELGAHDERPPVPVDEGEIDRDTAQVL